MSFTTRRIREEAPSRRWKWPQIIAAVLRIGGPVLGWYSVWKQRKQAENRRVFILKRAVVILLALFFAFLLFAGVARALIALRVVTVPGVLTVAGTGLPTDKDGFTNFLLLGQGDVTHDGKDLTDTIMIVSLDPRRTKSAVLLSLPRDLYFLETDKMGKGRINSLYRDYKGFLMREMDEPTASMEAMKELAKEISKAIDLPIHHVIKVDFDGFIKAVDAVGGIDIVVPQDIVDVEYPGPNYTFETFEIAAGPHHVDGDTALKYARSRHTTSDFDRSARQQQILQALSDKVRSRGILGSPSRIMGLYKIVNENLETTMTVRELVSAAKMGTDIDHSRLVTMQLSDRNGLYGTLAEPGGFLYSPPRDLFEGAAVLLPVSIPEFPVTWKQIRTLSELLFRNRALFLSHTQINVLNAGAKSGLGRALATELSRYGLEIDKVENAGIKQQESVIIPRSEKEKHVATFLSTLLKVPVGTLPPDLPPENAADITILVGQGYSYQPLQALLPDQQ